VTPPPLRLDHIACVPVGCDEVWRFVNDIPAVVECVPGAQLVESVAESTYRGLVRISVGPFSLAYEGALVVIDSDDDLRTLRMEASGRDRRGAGAAHAALTVALLPEGTSTNIHAGADVALTGPVASLPGVARAVSRRLFAEFAGQMCDALAGDPSHGRRADRRRESVQVAPLLWSVTRQRVAGYVRRLGRLRP
jgi:uncharacterized protein